jgi:hypothetical protein
VAVAKFLFTVTQLVGKSSEKILVSSGIFMALMLRLQLANFLSAETAFTSAP